MPDVSSLATIRAVVETVVPPGGDQPGAAELGVERHVAGLIEQLFPRFVDLLAMLLDAYAADVRQGALFVELETEERGTVLRTMSMEGEGTQDMRDAVDALMVFTLGGVYSEWSGYDRATGALTAPASWKAMGYHGPVAGHPRYREGV